MQPRNVRPSNPTARREFAGLVLTESHYPGRLRQPRHAHEPASFSLVLSGGYDERVGRRSFTCRPATVVFRPPAESHSVAFADAPVSIFRLDLSACWLESLCEAGAAASGPARFADGPPLWLAVRLRREFDAADQFSELAVEALALELLAATARTLSQRADVRRRRAESKRPPPHWLERAREIFREGLHDAPTVGEVARTVGVHPVHLAHEFRRFYGTGAGEFARGVRVRAACRLLARTGLPLSQVAALSGFYDQSHLTNSFRRATGITPAQYRAAVAAS